MNEPLTIGGGTMRFPEEFRWVAPNVSSYRSEPGDRFGVFLVPGHQANGRMLRIIAVDGEDTGWEHVSVSLPDSPKRCPSWEEMCGVKRLFWPPEACVVQFHPAEAEYVNQHAGCLHLWRCVAGFPTPPIVCV